MQFHINKNTAYEIYIRKPFRWKPNTLNFIDRQNTLRQQNLFPIKGLGTGCKITNVRVDFNLVQGTTKPKAEEQQPDQTCFIKSWVHYTTDVTVYFAITITKGDDLSIFNYQCQHCCTSHYGKPSSFVSYNYHRQSFRETANLAFSYTL